MNELRNPAWESLCSRQEYLNMGDDELRYYPEDVSPFLAMHDWDEQLLQMLSERIPRGRSFSMVHADKPDLRSGFEVIFDIPLYQMACKNFKPSNRQYAFRQLTTADVPQMLELTAMTKPGPFFRNTIAMGTYIGIFENGQLVAMAGERMKCDGFTEVSAICTHPSHTGKGYASFLTTVIADGVYRDGCTPFLHVKMDNEAAIKVYEKMGFSISNHMYFAVFRKS